MPSEEAWLMREHRFNPERKCYLANLPQTPRSAIRQAR